MTDRLAIDAKINSDLIPRIDDLHFLNLDKSNSDRIEMFLFAMALGVKAQKRTPLKASHGFILETAAKSFDGALSLMYSLLISELRKTNEEEKIDDKECAFHVAEEYANTGFLQIQQWMNKHEEPEDIMYTLIAEMDDIISNHKR